MVREIKQLVAIAGPVGSGKDTLADSLVMHLNFTKFAFSHALKEMLYTLPFLEKHHWDNREWKEKVEPFYGKSPRYLAQTLGTEWGRDLINPNIWVKISEYEMLRANALSHAEKFVFCDLRFENEAKWIRSQNGLVVHLHRGGSGIATRHQSEDGVKNEEGDMHIYNESTIEELSHTIWMITARAKVLKLRKG